MIQEIKDKNNSQEPGGEPRRIPVPVFVFNESSAPLRPDPARIELHDHGQF